MRRAILQIAALTVVLAGCAPKPDGELARYDDPITGQSALMRTKKIGPLALTTSEDNPGAIALLQRDGLVIASVDNLSRGEVQISTHDQKNVSSVTVTASAKDRTPCMLQYWGKRWWSRDYDFDGQPDTRMLHLSDPPESEIWIDDRWQRVSRNLDKRLFRAMVGEREAYLSVDGWRWQGAPNKAMERAGCG